MSSALKKLGRAAIQAVGLVAAGTVYAASPAGGVRLLQPGETMQGEALYVPPDGRQESPSVAPKDQATAGQLDTVLIASADGDASKLAGLIARNAPFQVVAPTAKPDLVWDGATHDVSDGSAVVSFAVALGELGTTIDRTAVVRALARRAAGQPQSIRLDAPNRLHHKGEVIQILVDGIAGRALLLVNIAGDGHTQLLFPGAGDAPLLKSSPFSLGLTIGQPFGTDVLVAISSAQPIDPLIFRLKEARPTEAAEFLALIDQSLPKDAHIGLLTLSTVP